MFQLTNNTVVAPITTAVFRPMKTDNTGAVTETFTQYLEDHRCSNTNTIATVGGMLLFLATDAGTESKTSSKCAALFRPGAAAQILGKAPESENTPTNDDQENIAAARKNLAYSVWWIVNLVNRAHKKSLTPSNVEGFFAMLNHKGTSGGAVAWFINSISPFFPDSISVEDFRARLVPGAWTSYSIARVTTGRIMWKNIDAFRETGITTPDDEVEAAIKASADAPWDVALSLNIPEKYKAYMCLYLEASGTPIDNWYQGNKARDALPAARVRGAKEIFRRYLEVKHDVTGLNEINATADFRNNRRVTEFW
jgi:hypothetical protein